MIPMSLLPVLVTAVLALIAASVVAAIALWWDPRPRIRLMVRRIWFALTVFVVLGVAIFWISTAMVERPGRTTVDRSLQQQQQNELQKRLQNGGH